MRLMIKKSKTTYDLKLIDDKNRIRHKLFIENITKDQKDFFQLSRLLFLLYQTGMLKDELEIDEVRI